MVLCDLTVAIGETNGAWVDVAAFVADRMGKDEKRTAAAALFVWDGDYDQAGVTLEFAEDTVGTDAGALYDIDGTTVLSALVMPAAGLRTALNPSDFCYVKCARVVLPVAASEGFTFGLGVRHAG